MGPGDINPLEIDGLKLSLAELAEGMREYTRATGDRFDANERTIAAQAKLGEELARGLASLSRCVADLALALRMPPAPGAGLPSSAGPGGPQPGTPPGEVPS